MYSAQSFAAFAIPHENAHAHSINFWRESCCCVPASWNSGDRMTRNPLRRHCARFCHGQTQSAINTGELTLQEAFAIAEQREFGFGRRAISRAVSGGWRNEYGRPTAESHRERGRQRRDTPHESLFFDLPLELGGKRSTRISEAKQEVALTDIEMYGAERVRDLRRAGDFAAVIQRRKRRSPSWINSANSPLRTKASWQLRMTDSTPATCLNLK